MLNIARFCVVSLFLVFIGMKNGVTSSIKPQQITYIVPGIHNFDQADIADFVRKAQDNMVSFRLGW